MALIKIHKCCICHEKLDYKPHRLVYQEYREKPYKQYYNKKNYDFCDKCFKVYKSWIIRHKEKNS